MSVQSDMFDAYPNLFPPVNSTLLSSRQSNTSVVLGLRPVTMDTMQLMPNQSYGGGVGAAVPSFPYLASNDPLSAHHDVSPMESEYDSGLVLGSSAASFNAAASNPKSTSVPDLIKDTPNLTTNNYLSNELSAVLIPTPNPVNSASSRFNATTDVQITTPVSGGTLGSEQTPSHVPLRTHIADIPSQETDDLMYFASDYESIHDYLTLECFDPLFHSKFTRGQDLQFGDFHSNRTADAVLSPAYSSNTGTTSGTTGQCRIYRSYCF